MGYWTVGGHPDEEQLSAYTDGGLSGDERNAVTIHLNNCTRCFDLVTEMMKAEEEIGSEPTEDPKLEDEVRLNSLLTWFGRVYKKIRWPTKH